MLACSCWDAQSQGSSVHLSWNQFFILRLGRILGVHIIRIITSVNYEILREIMFQRA